ncbi:MAG: UDP-N-acetylglucosamine 1-carboxyvinyltransferase [Candidatus Daviesbacteria bacterium]|nr:UDP-N-acetylglucosamine 1-carboxyvinyltransferase [Candidatus Daviesbacteria bacterium]
MSKYIINGGIKLKGKIRISGNKNSILPCMAATLLTEEEVVLHNVPHISDVEIFCQILQTLGAEVTWTDHTVKIISKKITESVLPKELASKLRASILLVGALISRLGKAEFSHPGGDVIGRRGIDQHLMGFEELGCRVQVQDNKYKVTKISNSNSNAKIFFEICTVTGTENLILASVLKAGQVTIKNAACEPHVVDLCKMLTLMGAKIEGIGTSTLKINGVNKLKGAEFTIGSDYIEFGTYAIAAAITGGEIEIENCCDFDEDPIMWPLLKMGLLIKKQGEMAKVSVKKLKAIPHLVTNVWPGFPTDLMSPMVVLATQAKGVSLLHDWIYDGRMFFVDKLIAMGAEITVADPHRVLVYGPTKLRGRNLETPDIRAGMALVLASLVAEGQSVIDRAELIERGYEGVVEKLTLLGADIQKLD